MNFTIEELQEAVEGLPPGGFFQLSKEEGNPAIFYDFEITEDYRVSFENYETLDVRIGSGWQPISCIDTLEGINEEIAQGQFTRLRYIVLC
jgi:hypothetical protein